MQTFKPPAIPLEIQGPRVFLAGSIEMGVAEMWQDKVSQALETYHGSLYNPRRDNWDSSWVQRESNPNFSEQVNWELDYIAEADYVFMYFDPNTKSPITLLELGLIAAEYPERLILVCPDGFWRKGNVEVICTRQKIKLLNTLEEGIEQLKKIVGFQLSAYYWSAIAARGM